MSGYTLKEKDELGFQEVEADIASCPLCGAKHTDYHTHNVYMVAKAIGGYFTAKVQCLKCGLEIKRCTEAPTGSLESVITQTLFAWNRRAVAGVGEA